MVAPLFGTLRKVVDRRTSISSCDIDRMPSLVALEEDAYSSSFSDH